MVDSFKVACVGWSSRQDGPLARPRVLGATVVPWNIDHAMRGEGLRASRTSNLFATVMMPWQLSEQGDATDRALSSSFSSRCGPKYPCAKVKLR